MIAPPARNSLGRSVAATPALCARGADGGDADNAAALAELDARVTALVARASSPADEDVERQREAFDSITRMQAEFERETNALRDLAMDQMKQDDAILKKWIELIG